MDKRLMIYKIFANLICSEFNDKLTHEVKYSYDGNNVEIWLKGYPLYPSKQLGSVIIILPIDYITIRSGAVKYKDLQQGSVRIYQEYIGKAFAHAHVWNCGEPCWDHIPIKDIQTLFTRFVHTLFLTNVTSDSVTKGIRCPDSIMTVGKTHTESLRISREHHKVILNRIGLRSVDLKMLPIRFNNKYGKTLQQILK